MNAWLRLNFHHLSQRLSEAGPYREPRCQPKQPLYMRQIAMFATARPHHVNK